MSSSYYANGKVNLLELKEWLRREFLTFFEECSGRKLIVWDNSLTGPIGLVAEYAVLKERGVDKMFDLKQIDLLKAKDVADFNHIFFIVKAKLDLMEIIANHIFSIERDKKVNQARDYHIIFVPRKTLICERKLQDLGVFGTFKDNIKDFSLDLIPLDYDLLSMENHDVYKDCFLYNDNTHLYHVAKAIMTLQTIYGTIPTIYGKGKCSKMLSDMLSHMARDISNINEHQTTTKIDTLILIDRTMDHLTPMMMQLTYEGLIDENFGIKFTQLEMPQVKDQNSIGGNIVETKRTVITLNSTDSLYAEIRDKNYNAVSSVLSRTAKELQQQYEQKNQLKSASEMRSYVEKTLKTYQTRKTSLSNHTTIAGVLKDVTENDEFMEDLKCQQELINNFEIDKVNQTIISFIAKGYNIHKVLRLICVHCFVSNGLKPKILEAYKREIVRAYGFKYIELFSNLQQVGVIYPQTTAKTFLVLSKAFKLIADDLNEQEPNDISYVYSGYAPLSVRLCQYLTKQNWKSFSEAIDALPGIGAFFQHNQKAHTKRRTSVSSINSNQSLQTSSEQKTVLVFFIGGCTFAEISALRFLSQTDDSPADFIIATTAIVNGSNLIKSIVDID